MFSFIEEQASVFNMYQSQTQPLEVFIYLQTKGSSQYDLSHEGWHKPSYIIQYSSKIYDSQSLVNMD